MMLFGKKPEMEEKKEAPVQEVMQLRQKGLPNEDVITYLKKKGYSISQIRDAITQVDIKTTATGGQEFPVPPEVPNTNELTEEPEESPVPEVPETPVPESPQSQVSEIPSPTEESIDVTSPLEISSGVTSKEVDVEKLERVLEQMLKEKWAEVRDKYTELDQWKSKIDSKVSAVETRVDDVTKRVDSINAMLMGRLEENEKTMEDVGTSVQSLEKVMKNIVPELSDSVKELRELSKKSTKSKKK